MEVEFLKALVLIFGVSALSIFILHRIKIPPIIGFILAGVLIGPSGAGIIADVHEIETLAEIGVILLLFTVGIEFSLMKLFKMRRAIVLGGGGQVVLTIFAAAVMTYPLTHNVRTSIFIGFLVALSSTAIVLKLLQERGEMDSPQGRNMAGILIFQDLCIVPLMLLVPPLSGVGADVFSLALTMLKAGAIIALVLFGARWVIPGLLHQVVRTRSRELFIITIILMCLGIALFTSRFGLSLALGAFLAGLILSESEYAYQAMAEVLPFKDSFMGLFFVSIGMLMDVNYIIANWPIVIVTVLGVLLVKTATTSLSLLSISTSSRISIHAGVGIAQIGEFSFILAAVGKAVGLISGDIYQLFLSAAVITMTMTPFLLRWSPTVSVWLASRRSSRRLDRMRREMEAAPTLIQGHVIIVGFGLNGRNLAGTLREMQIPYAVLELNNSTVMEYKRKGEPIFFGDGTSVELLHKLGIGRARTLVIAISDPASTRKIVALAKKENPAIYIIVRTRYLVEVEDLKKLGADEVIPEEFETSIEIFSRVLHQYSVPRNIINDHIENIRKNEYRVFRTHELPTRTLLERVDLMSSIEMETYVIKQHAPVAGHSLRELHLRGRTGATVIAVEREKELFLNPSADFAIEEGDIVLLVGKREDLNRALEYLDSDEIITSRYH